MDNPPSINPYGALEDPAKKQYFRLFRWNRFFLPGVILAAVVFCILVPGGSASADPLMPTDFPLTFHIVEYGTRYLLPVELSYKEKNRDTPTYSVKCIWECFMEIRNMYTGSYALYRQFELLVSPEGRENFTIKGFYIYYSPHYIDNPDNIPDIMYHVTIDIGQKFCIYTPNSNDTNYQITGCLRENATAGEIGSATAKAQGTDISVAQATATANAQATATADARTATNNNNILTSTVRAQGTSIASSETRDARYAQITGTFGGQLTEYAATWNTPDDGNQLSPSFVAESTPAIGPQVTPASREQKRISVFPIPYLAVIYFVVILLAICTEMMVAFLMIRFVFEIILFPPWKIILSVSVINAISIPCAWLLMEFLTHTASMRYLFAVLLTEILVVVSEALWYRRTLSLHSGNALLLSLIANIMSYILGVILFGF